MSGAGAAPARKHCRYCGRHVARRRRWKDFEAVRFCSDKCRTRGVRDVDRRLEAAILSILDARARGASICPSEAARTVGSDQDWRVLVEPARCAARRLVHRGLVEIVQRGRVVDPSDFRGPVRVRAIRAT